MLQKNRFDDVCSGKQKFGAEDDFGTCDPVCVDEEYAEDTQWQAGDAERLYGADVVKAFAQVVDLTVQHFVAVMQMFVAQLSHRCCMAYRLQNQRDR